MIDLLQEKASESQNLHYIASILYIEGESVKQNE